MVYLIGAGGHGKVVLDALLELGCDVRLLDAEPALWGRQVLRRTVEREDKVFAGLEEPADFFVAIGDAASRRRVAERWQAAGHRLVRVIHPSARVSRSATLEEGVAVMAGAVVQAEATIMKGAIINTAATVDHESRIGEYAHLAPGVHLAGGVEVGARAWLGIGTSVREGVVIGARSVVGVGAVVVDDLPPDVVAYGNPCRVVRRIGGGEGAARPVRESGRPAGEV
jgi:sugar O-acyltransferase (sialic acid O-acetyltransferase NeuD family)